MRSGDVQISTKTMIRAVLVVAAAWVLVNVIGRLADPIIWTIIAAFLAVGLNPFIKRVERRVGGHRGLAVLVVTVGLVLLIALVVWLLIPPLVRQTEALINNLPHIKAGIESDTTFPANFINQYDLIGVLESHKAQIVAFVTSSFGAIFTGSVNLIGTSVTIFILFVYFVAGGPRWITTLKASRWGQRYVDHEPTVQKMGQAVSSYVVGNAITSALAFVAAFIMLTVLGIKLPLPLAFLYAIFDIIPVVGATLGGILLVAVALFQSLPAALIMLAFTLIYQTAENSFVQPKVYGKALELPGVVVMLAAILGGTLAGLVGALLAIPLAACIRVGVLAYLNAEPKSKLVHTKGGSNV